MVRRTLVLVLCALVSAAVLPLGTARADPVPVYNADVVLAGAGTVSDWITIGGNSENVWLGPYSLQVSPTGGGTATLPWMCFDADPNVYVGQPWSADLTQNKQLAADLWFGTSDSNGLAKIDMISWLATQAGAITDAATLGAINEAMWEISADYGTSAGLSLSTGSFQTGSPSQSITSPYVDQANYWLNLASSLPQGTDYGNASFLIPLDFNATTDQWEVDPNVQPFVSSVPEPSTLLLLASGLVGMVGFVRKRGQI